MTQLELHRGPTLISRRSEGAHDVTSQALSWLFEPVELAQGVRVADLFLLLQCNPVLRDVYSRDFAHELYAEAAAVMSQTPCQGPSEIEYVEVYRNLYFNSATRTYEAAGARWEFHGVGHVLQTDDPHSGARAGSRIQYSLSLTALSELLELELRVKLQAAVTEQDTDSSAYGRTLETVTLPPPTLGELLHAVLWELSFHGAPEERVATRERLLGLCEQVRAECDLIETQPFLFADARDVAAFDRLFERWPRDRVEEFWHALRAPEDRAPAAEALRQVFSDAVELRREYAALSAYELRRAWSRLVREMSEPGAMSADSSASGHP